MNPDRGCIARTRANLMAASLALGLAACAADVPDAGRAVAPEEPPMSLEKIPEAVEVARRPEFANPPASGEAPKPARRAIAPLPPELLAAMQADLATRLGARAPRPTVAEADEVVWPDGSLGCPQPGMNYTMALVPGWRVVFAAGEARYAYHAAKRGGFVQCSGAENAPPPPGIDATR